MVVVEGLLACLDPLTCDILVIGDILVAYNDVVYGDDSIFTDITDVKVSKVPCIAIGEYIDRSLSVLNMLRICVPERTVLLEEINIHINIAVNGNIKLYILGISAHV